MAGWQDSIDEPSTTNTDDLGVDLTIVTKLTIVGNGTITKLRWYQAIDSTSGNAKFFLYDDSSPLVLLGSAAAVSINIPAAAYIEATLTAPVAVVNGQVVWIGINNNVDAAFDARYLNGGASNAKYKFESYAGAPTSSWTPDGTLTRTYAAGAYLEDAAGAGFVLVAN